jgi:hypothetical protein
MAQQASSELSAIAKGSESRSDNAAFSSPPALTSPSLNRGTAFSVDERRRLGLTGRLPSAVLALEDQAQRLWNQLQSLPSDLAAYRCAAGGQPVNAMA